MMGRPSKKIVVSGIGLISSLGGSREKTWAALLDGQTGIRSTPAGLQAPIFDFVLNGARSRMGDFSLVAAEEALRHAGFDPHDVKGKKIGLAISQSKPILQDAPAALCNLDDKAKDHFAVEKGSASSSSLDSTLAIASFSGWSAESVVKNAYRFEGPSSNRVAACATGIAALDEASYWLQSGQCEMALVGASESSLHPLYVSGFRQMGVLSEGNSPQSVCPFDKKRQGFAIAEGSAVLFLETEESAARRSHKPLAQLSRFKLQHSSIDAIRFDEKGEEIEKLIRSVVGSRIPDYVNAHGTGTIFNDRVETLALKRSFGKRADSISVSSTKAATGHLLGAAGSMEAAFSVLALRDQVAPPTIHLTDPDPECDLDYTPLKPRKRNIDSALTMSYGFGGQMGAALFESIN